MTTYATYGRLTGSRGRELTAAGSKARSAQASVENVDGGLQVGIDNDGTAYVILLRKDHAKAKPEQVRVLHKINIKEALAE